MNSTKGPRLNILNTIGKIQASYNRTNVEENYTVGLNKFYSELVQTEGDVYVNYLYNLKENLKKGLTEKDCINLTSYVQELIIAKSNTTYHTTVLKNYLKLNTDKLLSYTKSINKEIDLVYVAQRSLFANFDDSDRVVGYKVDWSIGSRITRIFRKAPKYKYIQENLKEDLKDIKNVVYLVDNIIKKTPPTSINKDVDFRGLFDSITSIVKHEDLIHLMVILSLYDQLSLEMTKKNIDKQVRENLWLQQLIDTFRKKTNKEGQEELLDILDEMKIQCINIINVYAKVIGVELTEFFKSNKIILSQLEKDNRGRSIYFYRLADSIGKTKISHKLPSFYLPSSSSQKTMKENLRIKPHVVGHTTLFNDIIEKTGMHTRIFDYDTWYNSQGTFYLNLQLIKEFLNLIEVLTVNPLIELGQEDVNFLNAVYRVNFNVLKYSPEAFNEVIRYALDFKNLTLLEVEKSKHLHEINASITSRLINKIYQQKYLLIYFIDNLEILLHLESFQCSIVFDQRGRAYPEASLINHLQPLFKYFFSWQHNVPQERRECDTLLPVVQDHLSLEIQQEVGNLPNLKNPVTLNPHKPIPLKHLCSLNLGNKLFETYVLCDDVRKLQYYDKEGKFAYYYSVDACSSGFQIITMLTQSRELAQQCGLITEEPITDIYSRFVNDFHAKSDILNGIRTSIGGPIYEFVKSYRSVFVDKKFNDNVRKRVNSKMNEELLHVFKLWKNHTKEFPKEMDLIFDLLKKEPKSNFISFNTLNDLLDEHNLNPTNIKQTPFELKDASIGLDINNTDYKDVLEKLKKRFFSLGKKMITRFISCISLMYDYTTLETHKRFFPAVNRKLIKNGIMTFFYGSANSSRRRNYLNNYIDQAIEKGICINGKDEDDFKLFAKFIDKSLTAWINTKVPQVLILRTLFNKFNSENIIKQNYKLFKPTTLRNEHCAWYYRPPTTVECIKSINHKNYRLKKYTKELNRKKLKSSFLANYIQLCDAKLCAEVTRIMKSKKIPLLTVHDCFKCPYIYASQLNEAILVAYKKFYDTTSIQQDFSQNNPDLVSEFNKMKEKAKITPFYSSEIKITNLIKH